MPLPSSLSPAKHPGADGPRRQTRSWRPLFLAVVSVAFLHFVTLEVVFTYASGWDEACSILLEESGHRDIFSGSTGGAVRVYVDPGYTCEYFVPGSEETLVLHKDLTLAAVIVYAITAFWVVLVGVVYIRHTRRVRSPLSG